MSCRFSPPVTSIIIDLVLAFRIFLELFWKVSDVGDAVGPWNLVGGVLEHKLSIG